MQDSQDDAKERLATSFGYREVRPEDKSKLVSSVFNSVATRYDLMNDLMSGGVHRLWKAAMVDWLAPKRGQRFLDVAGGTGDIAFRILNRLGRQGSVSEEAVIVADISQAMLQVGRDRAIDRGHLASLAWLCANAEDLPLPARSVDAYTIAFGIRNVTRIDRVLAEAARVLAPGGRFLCLEFSKVHAPLLGPVYDAYSFTVLPRLGALVVDDSDSYRYLAESIRRFPDQEAFADMIGEAGLEQVQVRNLWGGIAALHSARRL